GELRRRFVVTCLQRNRNSQLRIRALQEIALMRDAEAFDEAIDIVGGWSRDERREGVKVLLQALAERNIGRRGPGEGGLWGVAGRADAEGAQALRSRARAAAELPEGPAAALGPAAAWWARSRGSRGHDAGGGGRGGERGRERGRRRGRRGRHARAARGRARR